MSKGIFTRVMMRNKATFIEDRLTLGNGRFNNDVTEETSKFEEAFKSEEPFTVLR